MSVETMIAVPRHQAKTGPAARTYEPPELLGIGEESEEFLVSSDLPSVGTARERSLVPY